MRNIVVFILLINFVCIFNEAFAARRKRCNPGDTWKEDCHTCYCDERGRSYCSRELCPGEGLKMVLPKIREKREVQSQRCNPGDHWKEDCNSCFCSKDGIPGCTRMECPKRKIPSETMRYQKTGLK